jgi:sulfur carrier protein ThiS/ribosomal protein S18 acetylase RimI-like enzyme
MPTVRAEVVGEGVEAVDLASDATYGDVLAALGFSPHEATVLVDDTPVPEDRPVDADRVRVLRLVKGGAVDERAIRVRAADAADRLDVMRILDGAMLAVDADTVRERIDDGAVLVATVGEHETPGASRTRDDGGAVGAPVGALVRDGDRVTAVATRRRHRDRGVGSALIAAALETRGRLVATFDPDVRPFYESLGFDIEAVEEGDGRLRGTLGEPPRDGDAHLVRPVEEGDGDEEDGSREVPGEAG